MHDIRRIREESDAFDAGLEKRGLEPQAAALLKLDDERRRLTAELQAMQERRNAASKEIGRAKGQGDEAGAQALMDEVANIKEAMPELESALRKAEETLHAVLAGIPNLPLDDVPVGADESANVERHRHGAPPAFDFAPKQHFELGEALGLMDFETAAKLSGSRFVVLKGALARLERALGAFMLDIHTGEHGYTEVAPPLLVRDDVMFGTGQLPKFEEDQFSASKKLDEDEHVRKAYELAASRMPVVNEPTRLNLGLGPVISAGERPPPGLLPLMEAWHETGQDSYWIIPTAEVPLTNLVREDILDAEALPMRVTAFTPCFRAEAGAAGRDTRGMIRQHQFSKVELVSVAAPEQSADELERMLACAETVLKRLELPYRVVTLSTGDMGFSARKTYDIEVWLPGQDAYREISSCSLCGDFQARRMNARYRPAGERQPRFVHTLNGSGVAVGRALIAVMETYQQADGSIVIPDALKPYMGGVERIGGGA